MHFCSALFIVTVEPTPAVARDRHHDSRARLTKLRRSPHAIARSRELLSRSAARDLRR
jgi:hypothetical protein